MECKYGCNYKCSCNRNTIILQVTNECNMRCFNCPQKFHNKSTMNREQIEQIFQDLTYSGFYFSIMGGEFSLLPQDDQLFIYELLLKYNKQHVICTNNMDITYDGIFFARHITDFTYVPQKEKVYNIVALDNQLETIYNYLTTYSTKDFIVAYDRVQTTPYTNLDLFYEMLELPNVKMQAYQFIKKIWLDTILPYLTKLLVVFYQNFVRVMV